MTEFDIQSSLPALHRDALERLVFFNRRQREAEGAIAHAVDLYGSPVVRADATGLRLAVRERDDVQCLFALTTNRRGVALAGMVVYIRVSIEEILVLHIAVADRYSRTRRSGLEVVIALVRAVREAARRLRGVTRLRMLYLHGRQFQIGIGPRSPRETDSATDLIAS